MQAAEERNRRVMESRSPHFLKFHKEEMVARISVLWRDCEAMNRCNETREEAVDNGEAPQLSVL